VNGVFYEEFVFIITPSNAHINKYKIMLQLLQNVAAYVITNAATFWQ